MLLLNILTDFYAYHIINHVYYNRFIKTFQLLF